MDITTIHALSTAFVYFGPNCIWMNNFKALLNQFKKIKSDFLLRFITLCETWIYHYIPEKTKQQVYKGWHCSEKDKESSVNQEEDRKCFWDRTYRLIIFKKVKNNERVQHIIIWQAEDRNSKKPTPEGIWRRKEWFWNMTMSLIILW